MTEGIKLSDFEFYLYDIRHNYVETRTNLPAARVEKVDWFTPIGFTKNNSLIVIDIKGRKQWIKKEFWDSSSSPHWKRTDNYLIFVRIKTEDLPFNDMVKVMMELRKKDLDINN